MTNRSTMRTAFASDHAAVALKAALVEHVGTAGRDAIDLGTDSTASVDYPDYGHALDQAIADGRAQLGIAPCGRGSAS